MKREDIEHLAALSRIELSPERCALFEREFDDILSYVAEIKEVAGVTAGPPVVGVHHNVFREDGKPNEPERYTEPLLSAAPSRKGRYVEVKKILNTDVG